MNSKLQRGVGIVEIMIALTLGVVIILGITTLYTDSSRSLDDVSRNTRLTETATYAMDVVASDLELAGLWAELAQTPQEDKLRVGNQWLNDVTPPAGILFSEKPPCTCVGTGVQAQCEHFDPDNANLEMDYTLTSPEELGWAIFFPLYAASSARLNAETVATTNRCGAFDQADPNSEFVAIRRSSTCSATTETAAGCRGLDGAYHMQIWGLQEPAVAGFAPGDLVLTNEASDLVARLADNTVSPVYRYISRIYYVDNDSVLSRLYLDDVSSAQTYLKEELVDGVELLRFEWHVDDNGDGLTDTLTNSPGPEDWINVVGATIWMVIREPQPARGYTDTLTYSVAGASFTVPDGFASHRRGVFSRTVELSNIAGRRRL